jgi:hypothetical protein
MDETIKMQYAEKVNLKKAEKEPFFPRVARVV